MITLSHHGYGSQAYELEKEATQHKCDGDLDQSIQCLEFRKKLMGIEYIDTKLAKYLQHAGRSKEALAEIRWLLKQTAEWSKQMFGHQPALVRQRQQITRKMLICKDAALICKRAGLHAQQASFEVKQQAYQERREAINQKADAARKASFEKRKAAAQKAVKKGKAA